MSQKGKTQLLDSRGYIYMRENPRERKGRDYWRCFGHREHGCKARLITEGLNILKYKGEHNHIPPGH